MKKILLSTLMLLVAGISLMAMEGKEGKEEIGEFKEVGEMTEAELEALGARFQALPAEIAFAIVEQESDPEQRTALAKVLQTGSEGMFMKEGQLDVARHGKFVERITNIIREAQREQVEKETTYFFDESKVDAGYNFKLPIIFFEVKNETSQAITLLKKLQPGESVSWKKGVLDGGRDVEPLRALMRERVKNAFGLKNLNFTMEYGVDIDPQKNITRAFFNILGAEGRYGNWEYYAAWKGTTTRDEIKIFKIVVKIREDGPSFEIIELKHK